MEIRRDNLIHALRLAILYQEDFERKTLGYKIDSGLLAGWRKVSEAVKNGKQLSIEK